MKNLLFICSRNRLRSPTAEEIFRSHTGVYTDSAGLASDAETPLEEEQVLWADAIFVMESRHKKLLQQKFLKALQGKKIIVLNIPDQYKFMDSRLISLLRSRCSSHLP